MNVTVSGILDDRFTVIRVAEQTIHVFPDNGPAEQTYVLTEPPIRHRTGWVFITIGGTVFLANCDDCGAA